MMRAAGQDLWMSAGWTVRDPNRDPPHVVQVAPPQPTSERGSDVNRDGCDRLGTSAACRY